MKEEPSRLGRKLMAEETGSVSRLAELARDIKIAMLTTVDEDGHFISRPMAQQEVEFDGDLWFFAERDSRVVRNLAFNPHVGVTLSSNDTWISIDGEAHVVDDSAKSTTCGTRGWRPGSRKVPMILTWC